MRRILKQSYSKFILQEFLPALVYVSSWEGVGVWVGVTAQGHRAGDCTHSRTIPPCKRAYLIHVHASSCVRVDLKRVLQEFTMKCKACHLTCQLPLKPMISLGFSS